MLILIFVSYLQFAVWWVKWPATLDLNYQLCPSSSVPHRPCTAKLLFKNSWVLQQSKTVDIHWIQNYEKPLATNKSSNISFLAALWACSSALYLCSSSFYFVLTSPPVAYPCPQLLFCFFASLSFRMLKHSELLRIHALSVLFQFFLTHDGTLSWSHKGQHLILVETWEVGVVATNEVGDALDMEVTGEVGKEDEEGNMPGLGHICDRTII